MKWVCGNVHTATLHGTLLALEILNLINMFEYEMGGRVGGREGGRGVEGQQTHRIASL